MIGTQLVVAAVAIFACVQVGAQGDPPPRTLAPIRPRQTLKPIQPRAPGPACRSPLAKVVVPPGGTVTVTSPSTRSKAARAITTTTCGWVFSTDAGQTLSISCQQFSLANPDNLIVTERGLTTTRFRFSGTNGPSNKKLATNLANVAYRYDPKGRRGFFTCDVTASGGAVEPKTTTVAPPQPPSGSTGCRCGIVNRASRIVGGSATDVNEYPWQVGLITTYSKDVFCGATIIDNRHVLTAAHCTADLTLSNFRLLLGGHSTASTTAGEFIVRPLKITDHPNYSDVTYDSDMSIIEIPPIDFNDPAVTVRPICLPDSTESYDGTLATVTGWGTLQSDGRQPTILQEVQVPVVSTASCREVYGTSTITARMLCAGTAQGGKDSCQGDSGGPLIAPDGANYELIGVVSFGSGCGDPGVPGVYARVTALQSWITSNTAGSTTCPR